MATTYICKCGRRVSKSTNADTTGNRDTENCKGCPYLLPWGPFEFVKSQGFVRNVKGYECRMSKDIEYATRFCGSIDDKCSCYIASLDFDFLTRVSNWIKETYPGGELNGSFFTDNIRAVEYVSNGRYRMSIGCAQNKKGIAAKAALLHQFFDASGARLDMTPEEEKVHILAAIEAGKAKAQERKESMEYTISKHVATGRLYAYYKGSLWFWDEHVQKWLLSQFAENLYQEYCKNIGDFTREDMLAQAVDFYLLDDYEVSPNCIETLLQCNPKTAIPAPASAESPEIVDECSEPNCTCSDCKRQDCTCAGGCDAGDRGKCDGEKNCAQDGCTYTAKHQENPTPAAPVSPVDAGAAAQSLSDAEPVSLAAASCLCRTCGSEDCPGRGCNKECPNGSEGSCFTAICPGYIERTDIICKDKVTNAPSADAAATSDGSAARMCEGPDEETRITPAAASGAALESLHAQAVLPQNAPAQDIAADAPSAQAFDYSGMDVSTADTLRWAEREIREARRDYISRLAQAVYIAHNTLCATVVQNLDTGKFVKPEDTFQRWCESVGIKRSTAYNLLQVQALLSGAAPEEQATLEAASPSLLYAAAKPSAPAELVQAVKDGDITTHKQFKELEAQLKAVQTERDEAWKAKEKAEQERDAARDAQAASSRLTNMITNQRDEAQIRAERAELRAKAAEEDAAGWKQAGLEMQELVDQRDERIRELESGITVEAAAVDQEEIDRRANELSEPLVKIIDQQNEQIERMASGNTVAAQASVLEQYLRTMQTSLLGNARRAELACYDVGALDSLAQALREFADEIDGIFEDRSEDND